MIIVLFLVPVAQAEFGSYVVQFVFTHYTEDLDVAFRVAREAVGDQAFERGFRVDVILQVCHTSLVFSFGTCFTEAQDLSGRVQGLPPWVEFGVFPKHYPSRRSRRE